MGENTKNKNSKIWFKTKFLFYIYLIIAINICVAHAQNCKPWGALHSTTWNETFTCNNDLTAIYINQDDKISNYFTFGSYLYNECVVINNATLYIDVSAVVYGCKIILKGSQAKIVIQNGVKTYFVHNKMSSGNAFMWDGIEVSENSTLKFYYNQMNDAKNGIYNTGSDCTMIIVDNKFDNNLYSIKAGTFPESQDNVLLGLKSNMFNSTSNLKYAVFEGDIVASLSQPRAAILIFGIDVVSKHSGCDFSYINNHSNGIIAYNCNISINNYIFQNINRKPQDYFFSSSEEGNAIAINVPELLPESIFPELGKDAMIVGFNTIGGNPPYFPTMVNVDRGINYRLINLNASKLSIDNCNKGISGRTRISETVIKNNHIDSVKEKGVEIFGVNIGYLRIEDNKIVTHATQGDNSIGIDINYVTDSVIVGRNKIYMNQGSYGILIRRCNRSQIKDNEIYFQNPAVEYKAGILINGVIPIKGHLHSLIMNNIYGISALNYFYPGIEMIGCPETSYICNELSETPRGLEITGSCLNSSIALTEFNTHRVGIYYNFNGHTGDQKYKSNFWLGTYNSGYRIKSLIQNGSFDKYWVYRDDINTIRDPYPCMPPLIAVYSRYGEYIECESSPSPILIDTTFSSLDSLIAIDSACITDFPIAEQWYQDYYLYSKINRFQIPVIPGTLYDSFYVDCQQNGIADFVNVKRQISSIITMPNSLRNSLHQYQDKKLNILDDIAEIDSIYIGGGMNDSTYIEVRRELQDSIIVYNAIVDHHILEFKYTRNNTIFNTILPMVSALNANNNASIIYKKFFRLESKYIAGELSSIDSAEILSYSNACLERYQNGVLGLQALAVSLGDTVDLIFDCSPYNVRKAVNKTMEWKLFPNPLDKSKLYLSTDKKSSGTATIYTIQGNKAYSVEFYSSNNLSIDLKEKLTPGIYILVIRCNRGVWTSKFIKH